MSPSASFLPPSSKLAVVPAAIPAAPPVKSIGITVQQLTLSRIRFLKRFYSVITGRSAGLGPCMPL